MTDLIGRQFVRFVERLVIYIFFEAEKREDGMWRQLDYDEVFEKYKDLENIVIEDIWQKYVPIGQEGGE